MAEHRAGGMKMAGDGTVLVRFWGGQPEMGDRRYRRAPRAVATDRGHPSGWAGVIPDQRA